MPQATKPRTNGHGQQGQTQDEIRDDLDIQARILSSSSGNPLLEETNLGLGNYDEDYKWQQIRSLRKGLYAWIAFGSALTRRQIYETKWRLGEEGYNPNYSGMTDDVEHHKPFDADGFDSSEEDQSRWNAIQERGEEIWQKLGEPGMVLSEEQAAAVHKKTGVGEDWMPIFWQLVSSRHEVSRSDGAELLRDALTGVKELREGDEPEESLL